MTSANSIDYERSDAEPWLLGALAAGIAAFLALAPLGLALVYPGALHQPSTPAPSISLSAPRLQVDPTSELTGLRRAEDQRLSSYGWMDREGEALHLPIERAMSLVHQRGLSGWQTAP